MAYGASRLITTGRNYGVFLQRKRFLWRSKAADGYGHRARPEIGEEYASLGLPRTAGGKFDGKEAKKHFQRAPSTSVRLSAFRSWYSIKLTPRDVYDWIGARAGAARRSTE
jgi:hypothetical protein